MNDSSEFDHSPSDGARRAKSASEETFLNETAAIESATSFILHGCYISRRRLDRLWNLAREGFPAEADVSIASTISTRRAAVEAKVESKSIDALLAVREERTFNGNPSHLDNLRLHVSMASRSVTIMILGGKPFSGEGVHVSVSGDEEWVRGRGSVLRDLLEDSQAPLISGRGHSRIGLFSIGIMTAIGSSFPLASALGWERSLGGFLFVLLSLAALLSGGGFFAGSLVDRRNRTHLDLGAQPRRDIDKMGVASLVIGILGVIAIVVAALVAHFDAIHPH